MNLIARQAAFISVSYIKYLEAVTVETAKSILCSKPHKAVAVLNAAENGVIGKAVFNLVVPEIIGLCRSRMAEEQEG